MSEPFSIRGGNATDIPVIAGLAGRIWPETYSPILEPAQIDYMLELFYSNDSLEEQLLDGHCFLVAEWYKLPCGFADYSRLRPDQVAACSDANSGSCWKLNKIYLDIGLQGKGLGKKLLDAVMERVIEAGGQRLLLNVNRFNPAKRFYEKQGFKIIGEEDLDIGEGFFMNDYVMERVLTKEI